MKKIRKLLTILAVSVCSLQSVWAQDVVVEVSLLEPGSLGVEILRKHDPITEVTHLTVTGEINSDDWATIQNLTALRELDLTNAIIEAIPARQFSGKCTYLTTVILPDGLKTIGESAFSSKSNLTDIYLPSTLTSLGSSTFNGCTKLESIHLDALPSGVTVIPSYCFSYCESLQSFIIPEGVTSIGSYAFNGCKLFTSTIPSTITSIGSYAFSESAMNGIDVVLSENVDLDDNKIFYNTQIKSISFPSTYYNYSYSNYDSPINNCTNLTDIYLKSPTVLSKPSYFLRGCSNANLKIHVPAHLVEAYKLDSYFKNYSTQIVGDATVGANESWTISSPLTLSYSRMPAASNIILKQKVSLQVKGSETQTFGDVVTFGHTAAWGGSSTNYEKYGYKDWSMILNTCDNVSITGTYKHKIQTIEKHWYFFSLPFDFKVSDIETEKNSETGQFIKYAIRYYDGANRASTNAAAENWKDYDNDAIIPAGTGFIIQTSATTWVTFKAQDNASKSYVMSNNEFVKALADNNTDQAAHKGWNLVGNPWQCYYNIHKLNYTAPISLWNGSTYIAYSIADDDYAIRPNEAFFVQSPGNASISFPVDGRQLTSVITSQNGSRIANVSNRQIFDLQIAYGDLKDKTRLVVNPDANLDFEFDRDASKMISMDADVPQIYSLGLDQTQYAINERPAENGELRLGLVFRHDGEYTLSSVRNSIGQVFLKDNETGITTDLSQNEYSFSANAGITESRFTLAFSNSVTGIKALSTNDETVEEVFTLDGVKVANDRDALKKGIYVIRKGQQTQKVIIK